MDWIIKHVPDSPTSPLGGRPPADKRNIVRGIFWMLDNGAKWKDLPGRFGSKSTVHRWFQKWTRDGVFENVMREAGHCVEEGPGYRVYGYYVDGNLCKAKGGGDGIGKTKAGKGVKIMVMDDARGLPIAINTMSAGPHESQLVQGLFEFMLSIDNPKRLIDDKAYDSDKLAEELAAKDVELIAPHRSNRKPENKTQGGRALRRYKRRWTVERTIAWIQNFHRLCIRWEKSTSLFSGFLHLGCTLILLKEVLG